MGIAPRWMLCGILAALLGGWSSGALAQDAPAEEKRSEETAIPMEGFWPTEKMVTRMLDRIVEQVSDHYELDDEQMMRAREAFDRFPQWMQKNRGEIQSLMNAYFEALLDSEAPTPEVVAAWAQRVAPLVGSFSELVGDVTNDMSSFMTDDQRVMLEGEFAAFQTGIGMVSSKLGSWADGGYDPEREWIGTPEQRRIMREEDRKRVTAMREARDAKIAAMGGTTLDPEGPDAPGKPPRRNDAERAPRKTASLAASDEWVKYTEDFIRRYKLDTEQQDLARSRLRNALEERDTFAARIAADLTRGEKKLAEAKSDEEKQTARTELDRVKRPLVRRFETFKSGLDKIPTLKQKQEAALAESRKDDGRGRRGSMRRDAEADGRPTKAESGEERTVEPADTPPKEASDTSGATGGGGRAERP
ncbi:MAG: hypothetical protein IPM64_03960 [Phycisphaerales bacterium]|nr:hypothetical protein [Phycisphaerales bacterium]